ncbi:hypothetical protein MNBD_GAMMA13-695 [hydrothermal vent metagenome]|uniref:DUF1330 domain-containing protein n=1 Tax=hydrothermal vent metagenome TaxID=652676 RepID=A0A3B0YCP7_9ZZZZ
MSAFFVATSSIKDPEKFQLYAKKAGETFSRHAAEPVLRGKFEGILKGNADHHVVGIIKFPTVEALREWYDSDAYQALVPLRDEAADMTVCVYSVPSS